MAAITDDASAFTLLPGDLAPAVPGIQAATWRDEALLITVVGAVYATAARSEASDRLFLARARRSGAAPRDHGTLDESGRA